MVLRNYEIRTIQPKDNEQVAKIIRQVMTEFLCVGEGYSINDPEVDDMYTAYEEERACFFVLEYEGTVIGCGGIAPLAGSDETICELQKMYFLPEARGKGQGRKLLGRCLDIARKIGYKTCYLETVERMESANKLYQKIGFKKESGHLGNTGHGACDSFYTLEL